MSRSDRDTEKNLAIERLTRQRDEALARLAKVKALADEWDERAAAYRNWHLAPPARALRDAAASLRAVLDAPAQHSICWMCGQDVDHATGHDCPMDDGS